jgi:hypothetical protein
MIRSVFLDRLIVIVMRIFVVERVSQPSYQSLGA